MVNNIVRKGWNAFVSKQTNIFSAAFFIILTTGIGQVLGIVKYRLLVSIFGASSDLGAFFASFRVPDFLFQVVLAGALATSFIPIFSDFLVRDKKKEAFAFTSSVVTIGLALFVVISLLVVVFAYPLSVFSAPGFNPEQHELMARLMRLIQLSQIFFMLGTVLTAMLQSFQHFLIPGIAFASYNLGIIIGVLILTPIFGIYGAAVGVLIGSVMYCLVQIPLLSTTKFKFKPSFHVSEELRSMFKLMVPRSFTLIMAQVSLLVSLRFASYTSARDYVVLELAQTLAIAPVILFGQSIAQASFPALSLKIREKKEFLAIFSSSFNLILYLTLPISALLIVLRIPIVRLIYGADKLEWSATVDTGMTLAYFAVSLAAQSLIYLLSRSFFAFKDTVTPFVITLFSVTIYIVLSYIFVVQQHLPIYSLAFAYSISSLLSILFLVIFINRKIELPKIEMMLTFAKISIATLIMGVSLYIPIKLLDQLVFDTTRTINLIILTGIASAVGFISYVFFTWLLDIREAYYVVQVIKRFIKGKPDLKNIGEIIREP